MDASGRLLQAVSSGAFLSSLEKNKMLAFLACVIVVYILFRGTCAILYDGSGWVLQRLNPEEYADEGATAGYGSTVFFWICILLLSVLAWKLI